MVRRAMIVTGKWYVYSLYLSQYDSRPTPPPHLGGRRQAGAPSDGGRCWLATYSVTWAGAGQQPVLLCTLPAPPASPSCHSTWLMEMGCLSLSCWEDGSSPSYSFCLSYSSTAPTPHPAPRFITPHLPPPHRFGWPQVGSAFPRPHYRTPHPSDIAHPHPCPTPPPLVPGWDGLYIYLPYTTCYHTRGAPPPPHAT